MRVTKAASEKNRADIVLAAGQVIREQGLAEASVGVIGKKAGLTHGALYRHFGSKSAVASAAISADFDKIIALLEGLGKSGGGIQSYIQTYLAPDHRDHYIWGCPAAPLAAEIFRSDIEVQTAFHAGLEQNIAAIANLLDSPDATERHRQATLVLATLSGSMALARAVKAVDPQLSDQILKTASDHLLDLIAWKPPFSATAES